MKKVLVIFFLVSLAACSPKIVPQTSNLINNAFPRVEGRNLEQKSVVIPDSLSGKPAAILIGYQQKAQFDIDRWILGLLQAEVPLQIVEVPTIAGMMPQMVQGFIDNGMRKGIPQSDWASVVTVYDDAEKVVNHFGNDRPQNAHVAIIDSQGRVIWTANAGYSASQILEIKKLVSSL